MRQWQAVVDPTHAKALDGAKEKESDECVDFYYNNGLLYRKWRPEGSTKGDVRTCSASVATAMLIRDVTTCPRCTHGWTYGVY